MSNFGGEGGRVELIVCIAVLRPTRSAPGLLWGWRSAAALEGSSRYSPREKGGGPKGRLEWTAQLRMCSGVTDAGMSAVLRSVCPSVALRSFFFVTFYEGLYGQSISLGRSFPKFPCKLFIRSKWLKCLWKLALPWISRLPVTTSSLNTFPIAGYSIPCLLATDAPR